MMNPRPLAAPLPEVPPTNPPRAACETMSADDVAVYLGIDRKTVYAAANRNEIPHRRLRKRILFSRAALEVWLHGTCKRSSES